MSNKGGIEKASLNALPTIKDRMTFIYLERCRINRDNGAILVVDENGITSIPAAAISVLLLGPGSDISHRAIELIGNSGISIIWVGEHGVRFYASGSPLTNHSNLLIKQAKMVSNEKLHIKVARMMYQMRFPNENVDNLTMQQLRGREGSRIRKIYREQSKKWNVIWGKRDYDPENYEDGDIVNKSLSAGNACLYGLAHAVISALGCSPGLGFVHVGHQLSFVYDIADLYKAELTIPIAFEIASKYNEIEDIGSETRKMLRDCFKDGNILDRMVNDIKTLLNDPQNTEDYNSTLYLWDNINGNKEHGISYYED